MTVRANKPAFNIREKLKELTQNIGLKGSELARAETVQEARDLVSAGRRNLIINGDLRVWQRSTSATINTSTNQTHKTADRWNNYHSTDGAVTESQSTDVPTGAGFYYSMKHEVSIADTSMAAAQYHCHKYDIEGYDVAHLMWGTSQAKPITVSFWAKSSVVGDYGFCIRPGANNGRFYVDTLTISRANTWEKYSFIVPGCPDGTWEKTTSAGLQVQISHSMGTSYQTSSLRQWESSLVVSPTSQVNWMGTVGNTWYITGLQLEVGKNATDFEHRSYGEELALCQRYYYHHADASAKPVCNGAAYQSNRAFGVVHLPVTMRTAPSVIATSGPSNFRFFANGTSTGFSTLTLQENFNTAVTVETSNTLSVTAGHAGWIRTDAGALAFNAEL